ncbi:MAG: PIN domain-containing protein [Chloroflexi bacterium]|nr:PIN domain-containing protein [Chloroflexota bacterium]
MTTLESTIPVGAQILLDSSVLVAHIEGGEVTSQLATTIIDGFLREDRNAAVISTVTVSEILVRPHRLGRARDVGMGVLEMPGLTLRSVDFLVAAEAARMRAESSLRLPDAIVLATGILAGATCFVTNDRRLAAATPALAPSLQVCLLSDHVLSAT